MLAVRFEEEEVLQNVRSQQTFVQGANDNGFDDAFDSQLGLFKVGVVLPAGTRVCNLVVVAVRPRVAICVDDLLAHEACVLSAEVELEAARLRLPTAELTLASVLDAEPVQNCAKVRDDLQHRVA